MTIAESTVYDLTKELPGARWVVRWSGIVFGARESLIGEHERHVQVDLFMSIEMVATDRAAVAAWLEVAGRRRTLLERRLDACKTRVDGTLLHVDTTGELSLTFDLANDALLYVRSPLVERSGFSPGAFDPPTAERVQVGHDAVA